MINNDILRSIRYMLDLSDNKVVEIIHLADPDFGIGKDDVHAFLLRDDMPGYLACSDDVLAHLLDGLIIHRRGRAEGLPSRPVEKRTAWPVPSVMQRRESGAVSSVSSCTG